MVENGTRSEDHDLVLKVLSKELQRDSKRNRTSICLWQYPYLDIFSDAENDWLTREITIEEVRQVVKQIGPFKACAPDGMHAILSKKY